MKKHKKELVNNVIKLIKNPEQRILLKNLVSKTYDMGYDDLKLDIIELFRK